MHVEVMRIMILITFLTELSHAEVLENFNVHKLILPTKECDLIVASQLRIDQGITFITNRRSEKPVTYLFRFGKGHNQV